MGKRVSLETHQECILPIQGLEPMKSAFTMNGQPDVSFLRQAYAGCFVDVFVKVLPSAYTGHLREFNSKN